MNFKLRGGKYKQNILGLASESPNRFTTSKLVEKHTLLSPTLARRLLNYYVGRGWLKRVPALLDYGNPDKRRHYISSYELTPEGELELQRLKRMFG